MGASTTIKQILIDKHLSITKFSEMMEKPRSTVANTFFKDNFQTATLLEYAEGLNCDLILRDRENGREYRIYP